jgi:hypothetical protein
VSNLISEKQISQLDINGRNVVALKFPPVIRTISSGSEWLYMPLHP